MHLIKTYILTGFLGSGKTTLLNFLLDHFKEQLNYIIENEFGKISIDGTLVTKNYEELFELNNGCICCSLDGELIAVLANLSQAEKKPDNLFIEASGVADAGQLASIFMREDVMEFFKLQQVICLVDAENFEDRLDEVPELYRQLVASDLVLINKGDLVQDAYIHTLTQMLAGINPFARISKASHGKFDLKLLEEVKVHDFAKHIDKVEQAAAESHRMKSIAIDVPGDYEKSQLYVTLSMSVFLHYHQIYRIKGYVSIKGQIHLVQSTGNNVTISPISEIQENPLLMLVFIGRDIERKGLEKLMSKALPRKDPTDF
jgi:G3E family GTPase